LGDHLVRQPIAEIPVALLAAQIHEGQDREHDLVECAGRLLSRLLYGGGKAITTLGHSDDVLVLVAAVGQQPTQDRDRAREAAFFDERVPPDRRQKLLLGDDAASVFNEEQQCVGGLGRDGDHAGTAEERAASRVEAERAKRVEPGARHALDR
jgi:hypothetical protein